MDIELSSNVILMKEVSGRLEHPYGFNISASDLAIYLPKCFDVNGAENVFTSYTRCSSCSAYIHDQVTTGNGRCKICSKAEENISMRNSAPNDVQKLTIASISQSALQTNSNTNLQIIAIDSSLLTNEENISFFLSECFFKATRSSDLFAIVFIDRCLRIPRLTVTESSNPIEIDIFDAKDAKLIAMKRLVAQGLYFVNFDRILDMLPRLHEMTTVIHNSLQTQSSSNNNNSLLTDGFIQFLHEVMDIMQSAVSSAVVTLFTGRTILTSRPKDLPPKMVVNAILIGQRQIDIQWIERVTRRSGGMIITAETLTESHVQNTLTALLSPPLLSYHNLLQNVEIEVLCSEGLRLVNISGAEVLQNDSNRLAEMITPIKKHYKSYKYSLQPSYRGSSGLTLLIRAVRKQSNAARFSSSARKFFNGSAFTSTPASSTSHDNDDTLMPPATLQIIVSFKGMRHGYGVTQQSVDITKVWTIPLHRTLAPRPLTNAWNGKLWSWAVSQAIVSQYEEASLLYNQISRSHSENWSSRQNRRKAFLLGIDKLLQNLVQSFMSSYDNRDKMRFVTNQFYGLREGPLLDGASVSLLESHLLRLNFAHYVSDIDFGVKLVRPTLMVLPLSAITAENANEESIHVAWREVPAECAHLLPNTISLMDSGDSIVLSFNDTLDCKGEWQGQGINEQSEAIQACWPQLVDDVKVLTKSRTPAAKLVLLPLPSTPNHRLLYSRLAPFPSDGMKPFAWKDLMRIQGPMHTTEAAWSALKRRSPITDQTGFAQWLLGLGLGMLFEEEEDDKKRIGSQHQPIMPMLMERGPPVQMMAPQYTMPPTSAVPPVTSISEV